MKTLLAQVLVIVSLVLDNSIGLAQVDAQEVAWAAWKNGDVEEAAKLASNVEDDSERNDLLFRCALVRGRYEEALRHYATVSPSYPRYREMLQPVIDCDLHLGRENEAYEFAQKHNVGPLSALKMRAEAPLQVSLDQLTIIPFSEHELTPYFPALRAELEGKTVTIHVDTGGAFLHMNPSRAAELGIPLIYYGRGRQGHRPIELSFGIARELKLGDALLRNVPVIAHARSEHIVLGTTILSQFFSTLDYPRERLILSPRSSVVYQKEHMELLPKIRVETPFYMWGDHYMFARGFVGEDHRVTFFMDSGLVALHPINDGSTVQAGFASSRERFLGWGYRTEQLDAGFFQSQFPIGIGPLRQDGIWMLSGPTGEFHGSNVLGGVQMHGILAHAFVKKYAWTLDCVTHKYVFSEDAAMIP